MGLFVARTRGTAADRPGVGAQSSKRVLKGLPPRFEAVGEALALGPATSQAVRVQGSALAACAVVGRELASDGVSLIEALDRLRRTFQQVTGCDPDFDAVEALSAAWSEAMLAYVHQLSCEDPMTGLASLAHVRCRLSEIYRGDLRGSGRTRERVALVVLDLPAATPGDGVTRALQVARLGDAARTVFLGEEVIGRVGSNRIVVVAPRDERLGQRVALLRRLVRDGSGLAGAGAARVWIEGLPAGEDGATALLDELAR